MSLKMGVLHKEENAILTNNYLCNTFFSLISEGYSVYNSWGRDDNSLFLQDWEWDSKCTVPSRNCLVKNSRGRYLSLEFGQQATKIKCADLTHNCTLERLPLVAEGLTLIRCWIRGKYFICCITSLTLVHCIYLPWRAYNLIAEQP